MRLFKRMMYGKLSGKENEEERNECESKKI